MVTVFDATTEFSEGDGTEDARLGPFVLVPARCLLQRLSENSVQEFDASTDRPKHRESVPTVTRDVGTSPTLQRRQRSNVQLPAKIPITVALIGSCPITTSLIHHGQLGMHAEDPAKTGPVGGVGPPQGPPLRPGGQLQTWLPGPASSATAMSAGRHSSHGGSTAHGRPPPTYRCLSDERLRASATEATQYAISCQTSNNCRGYWNLSNKEEVRCAEAKSGGT